LCVMRLISFDGFLHPLIQNQCQNYFFMVKFLSTISKYMFKNSNIRFFFDSGEIHLQDLD